jgi:hypothetical protein
MKILSGLIVTMSFILFITGCKKDDPAAPQSTCKITSIVTGGGAIAISYNTDGTIDSLSVGTAVISYSYSGNIITENTTVSGQFAGKVIVTVNSAGLATNVKSEYSEDGTQWDNEAYDYDGNQASKLTYTSSYGGSAEISTFQWSGGNLVSISDDGDVTNVDYYTDKASQSGDYLSLSQLIQGYEVFRNKNMIKSVTDGTDIINITYVFDNDGKVTSFTEDDGTDQTAYGLSYQCN